MPFSSPTPDLLVASILGRDLAAVDGAASQLCGIYGEALFTSEPLDFSWTDYYRNELGSSPVRRILALGHQGSTSELPEIKHVTCRLEVVLSRPGQARRVNIDPGFLGQHQLILASTKPRANRLHLGRGVYGDLMLIYQQGGFAPLPWTYPDYASDELRRLFDQLRQLLLETRRLKGTL